MSWTLGLEYVKALVWPVFALILILLFKSKVRSLLDRISTVDTPIGKATFDALADDLARRADRALEEAQSETLLEGERAQPGAEGEAPRPEPEPEPEPTPVPETAPSAGGERPGGGQVPPDTARKYKSLKMSDARFQELVRLAADLPDAAVALGWVAVEKAFQTVMPLVDPSYVGTGRTVDLIYRARRLGLLSPRLFDVADDLRKMRNNVLFERGVELTAAGAESYVRAARDVVDALALEWIRRETGRASSSM